MEPGSRTPLLDCFLRGDVPREVKLLAARGAVAPRAHEQLSILVHLASDSDREVAATASATIDALPRPALSRFLGRSDVGQELKSFFASRGIAGEAGGEADDAPLVQQDDDPVVSAELVAEDESTEETQAGGKRQPLSSLSVMQRIKLAMNGTREQRNVLIRDANRIVAAAVLSSPKLSESEVEAFARMTNVSEEVLRVIATSRGWTKKYGVLSAIVRNPKTPPALSLGMVARLNERDIKTLSIDRNVPEGLRVQARKMLVANESRRK